MKTILHLDKDENYAFRGSSYVCKTLCNRNVTISKSIYLYVYLEKSINEYNLALDKFENSDYLNAIIILKDIDPKMKEAAKTLQDLRQKLAPEIPELERLSINAYNDNDFELCITLLNRLLLIDPDNETARLYLPPLPPESHLT